MTMELYKKLNRQPLKLVLAEFRFSPIMQIEEYIPKIQEALRKIYPIPEKRSEQVIQIQTNGINVSNMDRWIFMTGNKKSAVDITQERIAYYTADYPRYDGFANACKNIIEKFSSIADPSLILRIGLRYSDLIIVEGDEKFSEIVDSHFVFPPEISKVGSNIQQRNETILGTDVGTLAIRTLYGKHNLTCFPDLESMPVSIEKDTSLNERLILDFDHFWEAKDNVCAFEVQDILRKLEDMHVVSRETFWSVTTDYARETKWS